MSFNKILSVRCLLLLTLLCASTFVLSAQSKPVEGAKYRVWLKSVDKSPTQKGKIIDVFEESILFAPLETGKTVELPVDNIRRIYYREENDVWRKALYGSLSGVGLGLVVGFSVRRPSDSCQFFCPTPTALAAFFGTSFGIVGGLYGLASGGDRELIKIGGSKLEFGANREQLLLLRYPL